MKHNKNSRDFDQEAATWETPPRVKLAHDIAGDMLMQCRWTHDMDVLDFGCGTGLMTLAFAPHVRSVTGADTSCGMLEVLQKKIRAASLDNVRICHLKESDGRGFAGPYHLIASSMTLHHVQDIRKLFENFYQALLPGGHIAIADLDEEGGLFHGDNDGVFHFGFHREHLGNLAVKTGFSDLCFKTSCRMNKKGQDGTERMFSIFLMTGRKSFENL